MAVMEKSTFQSLSGEVLTQFTWKPEGDIAGVVQLVHGMAEHMARYDAAAMALANASFLVVGHTHMGHGDGAGVKGFFGEKNGVDTLVGDIHTLRVKTQAEHPDKPYFLLGHSMGSFLTRCYIEAYAQGLSGVVLSGTGHFAKPLVSAGLLLSNILISLGQGKKPSNLINNVAFGGNNKQIEAPKTAFDWLSTDEAQVQKYIEDEYCGFPFTAYGYRDLFTALKRLTDQKKLESIPKALPIYLYSGTDDPVGAYGSGVGLVAAELRQAGVENVDMRLYKDGRHEMFNEVQAQDVYRDLIQWLYNHLA